MFTWNLTPHSSVQSPSQTCSSSPSSPPRKTSQRERYVLLTALCVCAVAALAGCKPKPEKPKEIPKAQRVEAANMASEADFALQIKDYARAEKALSRAVELDPDFISYWIDLGLCRRKLNNIDGARTAYKQAIVVCEKAFAADPKNGHIVIAEARVLVLLNRGDEARKLLDKAHREHPDDRDITAFWQAKGVDRMVNDPDLKQYAL